MKWHALLLTLGLWPTCAIAQNVSQSADNHAKGLYSMCKTGVRILNDDSGLTQEDFANGMYCMGYMRGVTAFMDPKSSSVCIPKNTTAGTLIRVFVKWMEDNPKAFDADTSVAVYGAFLTNYPCVAKDSAK